ncbi:something about silencing protein 10 [Fagus crenata]
MGKRGKGQKKDNRNPKRIFRNNDVASDDMDDEIDACFIEIELQTLSEEPSKHQNNINLLCITETNMLRQSSSFGFNDDDDDDDDEDDDEDEDTGDAAKIARTQKFLREKFGGVEDDMHEDDEEEDEEQEPMWGGKKNQYYHADNGQSSIDEGPLEQEEEVLKLQRQKAKSLTIEDFGLEDINEWG